MLVKYIKEIELINYRIFGNALIRFPRKENKNIHLIQGGNGVGKTTIVNAVRWCLFGEGNTRQEGTMSLPLCNCKALDNSREGRSIETMVRILVDAEDGEREITKKCITTVKNGGTESKNGPTISRAPGKIDIVLEPLDPVVLDASFVDDSPKYASLVGAGSQIGKSAWQSFGSQFDMRKVFNIDFPLFLDSPAGRLDLPLREKLAQAVEDLSEYTQIILLEHSFGIGDHLKYKIASTHKIEHKESDSNISLVF